MNGVIAKRLGGKPRTKKNLKKVGFRRDELSLPSCNKRHFETWDYEEIDAVLSVLGLEKFLFFYHAADISKNTGYKAFEKAWDRAEQYAEKHGLNNNTTGPMQKRK